jgi:CubicO group peptidase (beta-lactamase class C family)
VRDIADSVTRYLGACERLGRFSGAVLLSAGGQIAFSGGFGMADRERRISNEARTRFRIGSLTKPFTAMAILRLMEQGGLHIDQPVADVVPGFPGGTKITIGHLLDHSSGIPDIINLDETNQLRNRRFSLGELVRICAATPLLFEPGAACRYSNSGYIILAHVIETLTGVAYDQYIRENIFTPLSMSGSGGWNEAGGRPDSAIGYSIDGSEVIPAEERDPSTAIGCGGLVSTVGDLCAWDRALYTERLVSRDVTERLARRSRTGYCCGWRVSAMFQRRLVWHDGGVEGFTAGFYRFVDDQACVILLSNFEHAWGREIGRALAAILLDQPYSIPEGRPAAAIERSVLPDYEGAYRFSSDFVVSVTREEGRLFFRATRQPRFEILPAARDQFFMNSSPAELSFTRGRTGEITHLIVHQSGEHLVGKKLGVPGESRD